MRQWHTPAHGAGFFKNFRRPGSGPLPPGGRPAAPAARGQPAGPAPGPLPPLLRFLDQMKDPMILVLLGAAVLSLVPAGGRTGWTA